MSDTATNDDTDLLFRDDASEVDEMPTRESRRVATRWTVVLGALVIAAAGFVGGIAMEKRNAPASLSAFPTGLVGGFPTGALASGRPTGAGTTGAGTTGEIKLVDGSNVYITTSEGATVKVTTTDASKVTKAVEGALSDLAAGDTVTVQGTTGADGTIAATSITQTP